MNARECDILNILLTDYNLTQRQIAAQSGHSLGAVNLCIKSLINGGYIDTNMRPTLKAIELFRANSPENAIILAAGFGLRMIPVNYEVPKALLQIKGERLIERLINQLHEVGIYKIYVVVGFLKEQYEYLIDKFGVELVVNAQYAVKNNLHSMKLVVPYLHNSYVLPCDLWCKENPFHKNELYGWYMVNDASNRESMVALNRKMELMAVSEDTFGNGMIGISYIPRRQAELVKENILRLCKDRRNDDAFWEEALFLGDRMILNARVVNENSVIEINTFEQLREMDNDLSQLKADAMNVIQSVLKVNLNDIKHVRVLKKGMTNRSFTFKCGDKEFVMRIPGEGTSNLINRAEEASVYGLLKGRGICDDPVFVDPKTGYKISEYLKDAHSCDPNNMEDVRKCMEMLRGFHEKKYTVDHSFDLFKNIDFYEQLWNGNPSVYMDYEKTKTDVVSLKDFIEKQSKEIVLCHIDAVPDNFLFFTDSEGEEKLRLMDWEYAGMQDPHVDIAMFGIYSLYSREQIDRLISLYFNGACDQMTRIKIYAYIAVCGLLWSNWCEYKRNLGIEFGEYSLRQYRYAKEYYRIALQELEMIGEKNVSG